MRPTAVPLIVALLIATVTLSGCATRYLPSRRPTPEPAKPRPGGPATQRPYTIKGITYYPIPSAIGYVEDGIASWYGKQFHGRKTANGETYDMYGMTAAHKTLPMNTVLLVKNLENGKSTVVRVNDRGPFVRSRIIDLTYTAADVLDIARPGTARVQIVAMQKSPPTQVAPAKAGSPPPARTPEQPDFDKGKFYIQVGAFERLANARKLANRFADMGRDVVIQQYPAAGMNLYRVMIFSGTSLARARKDEVRYEDMGFKYALVINRE